MQTRTLEAPGVSHYYEVRGSGPVLLMIPGGPMDAAGFAPLADALADRYTVVTYDCRGNSRSTAEGPKDDLTVGVFADDAHRLLAAVTSEPAFVLGSSGGASYSLDLVARSPEQVRTLVAHEPPVAALLPEAAHWRTFTEEIRDIYRRDGVFLAMAKFGEGVGFGGGPEAGAEPGPAPDTLPDGAGAARAAGLGPEPVAFPGAHGGFASHPETFAARLHEVL